MISNRHFQTSPVRERGRESERGGEIKTERRKRFDHTTNHGKSRNAQHDPTPQRHSPPPPKNSTLLAHPCSCLAVTLLRESRDRSTHGKLPVTERSKTREIEVCFLGALDDSEEITVKTLRRVTSRRRTPEPVQALRRQSEAAFVPLNIPESSIWTRTSKMTFCDGVLAAFRRVGLW